MRNRDDLDVLPIQRAVANASPSAWRDGIVVAGDAGELTILLLDGDLLELAASVDVVPGDPVAFHPVAELLAVGDGRHRARKAG